LKEGKTMAESRGSGSDKLVDFMIGAGIGALITLLFAPKGGSELRSEIADTTRKGFDYARDTSREIGERASDLTARGKEAAGDLTERGKGLINRQKAQLTAAIVAGKQGYREAKQRDQGKVGAAVGETV
jgi:gas vesicle protein